MITWTGRGLTEKSSTLHLMIMMFLWSTEVRHILSCCCRLYCVVLTEFDLKIIVWGWRQLDTEKLEQYQICIKYLHNSGTCNDVKPWLMNKIQVLLAMAHCKNIMINGLKPLHIENCNSIQQIFVYNYIIPWLLFNYCRYLLAYLT